MGTAVDLALPFTGRWLVQNSPANRVRSHGTTLFATAYAIDFVPVGDSGRTAPFSMRSLLRPESVTGFPGFGRSILAPVDGTVVAVHNGQVGHAAHRGFPPLRYALTQRRRAADGWPALAGNHVFIETPDAVIALCHLRQDSISVTVGERVAGGELIAQCGNSGNSTEPHLHIQAIDDQRVDRARAMPITFDGSLPHNGEIIEA